MALEPTVNRLGDQVMPCVARALIAGDDRLGAAIGTLNVSQDQLPAVLLLLEGVTTGFSMSSTR
jgi:hypothetical protein